MSTPQRVSRGFHRVGLIFALIAGAITLVLIARDVVTLRLWDVTVSALDQEQLRMRWQDRGSSGRRPPSSYARRSR